MIFILKMNVAVPFDTLLSYHKTTRRHSTEDVDLNVHRRENFILQILCFMMCPLPRDHELSCLKL